MHANDRKLNFLGFRPTGDLADLTAYTSARNKTVWFLKAPPDKPPSDRQRHQRERFRQVGEAWRGLGPTVRQNWLDAARNAGLFLSGYTLFLVWLLCRDRPTIRTIERQTGITLVQ